MRICVIASSRFPIAEPFAGGLESWTHALVAQLDRRGHEVTLFAGPGTDPALPVTTLRVPDWRPTERACADVHAPPVVFMHEHHAYLDLMLGLGRHGAPYDVVHNSSLHHLPVAMAGALRAPMLTTLHTPPVPWLESAIALTDRPGTFVAVSEETARAWSPVVGATVIHNGVDTAAFAAGPGGGPAVWTGRMVREKAPHEAIDAARAAGVELVLAGPLSDPAYVEAEVLPRLGEGCTYAGHLRRDEVARLLGCASVALVTPAWDEPYGLVAAEAMACGTPVAAYDRGALRELVPAHTGTLCRAGDVSALAAAIGTAMTCDRAEVRAHAEQHCSLEQMVDQYERLYRALARPEAA